MAKVALPVVRKIPQASIYGICRLILMQGASLARIFVPKQAKLYVVRKAVRIRHYKLQGQLFGFRLWVARNNLPRQLFAVWSRIRCPPSGVWNFVARFKCGNPGFCPYCYGRRIRNLFERITRNTVKFRGVLLVERKLVVPEITKPIYQEVKLRLSKDAARRASQLLENSAGYATVSLVYPVEEGYEIRVTRIDVLPLGYPPPISTKTSVFVDLVEPQGMEVLEQVMHDQLQFPRELLYPKKKEALFALWYVSRSTKWLPVLVGGGELGDNADAKSGQEGG